MLLLLEWKYLQRNELFMCTESNCAVHNSVSSNIGQGYNKRRRELRRKYIGHRSFLKNSNWRRVLKILCTKHSTCTKDIVYRLDVNDREHYKKCIWMYTQKRGRSVRYKERDTANVKMSKLINFQLILNYQILTKGLKSSCSIRRNTID